MRRHGRSMVTNHDLRNVPGFRGCTPKQLAAIDRLADRAVVLPGRIVVHEGMPGRELYVILHGLAAVTRRGVVVTTLGPGDYFGELNAIENGWRSTTLTAISPLRVLIIGPPQFATLMADIPGFRDLLLRGMARRVREADDLISRLQPPGRPASCIEQLPLERTVPTL
jgi:CRP/FNR family cyclic AMP-dependent transcriptional regulator